jgi:hypothetical protein
MTCTRMSIADLAKLYRKYCSDRYDKWRAPAVSHLMDWMRIFPGADPHWFTDMHMLAKSIGVIREIDIDTHQWDDPDARSKVKNSGAYSYSTELAYIPREVQPTSSDPDGMWYEKNCLAPKPAKLWRMTEILSERLQIDYKKTIDSGDTVIHFKPVTGLKARLAKAKGPIEVKLWYGKEYRRHSAGMPVGVRVVFSDKHDYNYTITTESALRKHLAGLLGGKKVYKQVTTKNKLPGRGRREAWKPFRGPLPAIYSQALAGQINKLLQSNQIMAKPKWGELWKIHQFAKSSSTRSTILLVGGLFWWLKGKKIVFGTSFKLDDQNDDELVMVAPHFGQNHVIDEDVKITHKKFRKLIEGRLKQVYGDIGVRLGMLENAVYADYSWRRGEARPGIYISKTEGWAVDGIIQNLPKSLHERALEVFGAT